LKNDKKIKQGARMTTTRPKAPHHCHLFYSEEFAGLIVNLDLCLHFNCLIFPWLC